MNNSTETNMVNGTSDITLTGFTFWKHVISNIRDYISTNNLEYIKTITPLNDEEAQNYFLNLDFLVKFLSWHPTRKTGVACIEPILIFIRNEESLENSNITVKDVIRYGIYLWNFILENEYLSIKIVDDLLKLLVDCKYEEKKENNHLTKFTKEIENKCNSLIGKNISLLIMTYVNNGDIKGLDRYLDSLKVNKGITASNELKIFIDGLKIAYDSVFLTSFNVSKPKEEKKELPIIKKLEDLHIQKPNIIIKMKIIFFSLRE